MFGRVYGSVVRLRGHDYNGDYYGYDYDIQTEVLHQDVKKTTNLPQ